MEIMNGVERRRRWRLEDKLGIVAELDRPGACFAEVARRHDLSRGLLWAWRDQVRRGVLVVEPAPMFVPLQVTAEPLTPMSGADTAPQPRSTSNQPLAPAGDGRIEITLPDRTVIRVDEAIGAAALRRVLAVLRG